MAHRKAPVKPTVISSCQIFKGKFSNLEKLTSLISSTFGLLAALLTKPSIFPNFFINSFALFSMAFSSVISITNPTEPTLYFSLSSLIASKILFLGLKPAWIIFEESSL